MGTFMESAALHQLLLEMGSGRSIEPRTRLADDGLSPRWTGITPVRRLRTPVGRTFGLQGSGAAR